MKAGGSGTSSRKGRPSGFRRLINSPRARRFGLSVAGSYGVVLLFIISVALIGVIVSGAGMSPLPASIASMWMIFNLAPFRFNGTTLGLTPALPAVLMVAFIAWRVRREVADRISIKDVRALVGAYLGTPIVLTIIAWLMLYDASKVFPRIQTPSFGLAIAAALLVNLVALVLGMGQRLLRALLLRRKLPEWLLGSARLAGSYVAWLWLVGVVVTLVSLIWHRELLAETFAITDTAGESVAVSGLSLLYLPNVAFGAVGVLVGGKSTFGPAEAGLFAVHPAQLPPLPILAAMPQSLAHWAFGVLIVLPPAVAAWRVVAFLKKSAPKQPYLVVVLAAVWSIMFLMGLAWLLGGEVGIFGWAGASWWLTGLLGSMWLVVPGAIVVVAMTGVPSRGRDKGVSEVAAEKFPPKSAVDGDGHAEAEDAGDTDKSDNDADGSEESEEIVDGEVVATSEDEAEEADDAEVGAESATEAEPATEDESKSVAESEHPEEADDSEEDAEGVAAGEEPSEVDATDEGESDEDTDDSEEGGDGEPSSSEKS
ncbi:hypothetical protein CYJ42_08955 [Corynebacterium amycolatum]|nr:hypothetical protein CYJ42_08955 [Corynebacterium amycolatum]